jgi:hypothetical protein
VMGIRDLQGVKRLMNGAVTIVKGALKRE